MGRGGGDRRMLASPKDPDRRRDPSLVDPPPLRNARHHMGMREPTCPRSRGRNRCTACGVVDLPTSLKTTTVHVTASQHQIYTGILPRDRSSSFISQGTNLTHSSPEEPTQGPPVWGGRNEGWRTLKARKKVCGQEKPPNPKEGWPSPRCKNQYPQRIETSLARKGKAKDDKHKTQHSE